MVLMVRETEALADAVLPVAQLAAQMRLAEGYAAVPGQDERLRQSLRAAIALLERRLGVVLASRSVMLSGPGADSDAIGLPVSPVSAVTGAQILRHGTVTLLDGVRIEERAGVVTAFLPQRVSSEATLQLTVSAGWSGWEAIPEPLAQAVLILAAALDEGDGSAAAPMVETLIGPWKRRRIGGAA